VGGSERKTWWRNMATTRPVEIWLDGAWHPAVGHVVAPGERKMAFGVCRHAYPHIPADAPIVEILLREPYQAVPPTGREWLRSWIAWQPAQPLWLTAAVGALAGALMATTVSVLTGPDLRRLLTD
jgi:hypothetical protein